ncbi:hypothetical protein BCR33DRAFT_733798 [Rhizoclosmatium globosum]|uniref:Uncharacterized protein n=1 Tax=Rhizoclosmatium globosum TaxID=329046 RepID=A0A1Y2CWV7_9FUNG|nr:hypothetical protein BCR33DRAFT_733798 [Rhizoclosmatium globosum]|eukprot:ORY51513.1 hypothetical protein BCR33DRAFT_733798 [Rhizoclosmatium globosum]
MNLTLNCGTYNPNMYGITVDQIDLVAQMMVNTSYVFSNYLTKPLTSFGALTQLVGPPPVNPFPDTYFGRNDSVIGTAQSLSPIFFPSKQWVNYSLNFELSYTPDPYLGILRDPTILEIADACGITSRYKPPGRGMRIHYTAVSTIAAFKWLNFAPSLQNDVNIICPFWPDQIEKVISYVENDGLPNMSYANVAVKVEHKESKQNHMPEAVKVADEFTSKVFVKPNQYQYNRESHSSNLSSTGLSFSGLTDQNPALLIPNWQLSPAEASKPSSKWQRCLNCCIPRKKSNRIICGVVVLTLIVSVATLLGIYFPRFPEIKVYSIDLSNIAGRNSAFHFSFPNGTDDLNSIEIRMNLTMQLGTYNPNLYGLNVDKIDLNFYYTPDKYLGLLKDPTVLELADACGITSRYKPPGRPMKIQYTAKSTIPELKIFNYAPILSGDLHIVCPFSQEQIQAVIDSVQKEGNTVAEALKVVFG